MTIPLAHTTVEIVGRLFHAIWTPEDATLRAAGFDTDEYPGVSALASRLFASDPTLTLRAVDADTTETGAIPSALRAFADGDLEALDSLRVSQPATPFRGEVHRALRAIPAGETRTYTGLAALAGRPAAVRAAASGCATNLVALAVPCHRIVRTDGGLGGYLFGVDVKERLLRHEGAR